jgi:protein ImuB
MKRVMCIWLPDWPIQRLIAARPCNNAIVLYELVRGVRRVAACSAAARRAGIRVGMPLAEATATVDGDCRLHDPTADRQALEELCEGCRQFSPLVGIEDAAAPENLCLDLTGLARLFGGEAALGQQVVRAFGQRKLAVRLAVADTVGAAWAVAHFGREEIEKEENGENKERCVLSRKRSSEFEICNSRFSICNILPPGQSAAALRPLPIEALRLPDAVVDLLHMLGVRRIEQLERLPREELASRFGPLPLARWDQAVGRLPEPIFAQPLLAELDVEELLEYPTPRQATIELVLDRLLGRLSQRLVELGRGALRLDCRLECQGGPVTWEVGLFEPTVSPRHLGQLTRMELERLRLPGPVTAVSIAASITTPYDRPQEELFETAAGRRSRGLAGLVDRLSSRLGRQRVLQARLVRDAQPEAAYQYQPLVRNQRGQSHFRRGENRDSPPGRLPPRPLRLVRQPVAVEVISAVPEGPPARFSWRGREHRVARAWGPERIETGWWRGALVARDYYRVETTAGRRYWLFCRLEDGRWFLHGMFE